MKIAKPLVLAGVIVGGMVVASALAWPHLPDPSPTHFGLDGRPDRFGSRAEGAFVMPLAAALVAAAFVLLPRIMPTRGRLDRSSGAWATVTVATVAFLALAHAVVLARAAGAPVDAPRLLTAGLGVLLAVLGDLLGKVRYNFVFGVRTPWTLADERVWDRTHRAVGPWMMAWGGLVALGALWGGSAIVWTTAAGAVGLVLFCLGFSYATARRLGAA